MPLPFIDTSQVECNFPFGGRVPGKSDGVHPGLLTILHLSRPSPLESEPDSSKTRAAAATIAPLEESNFPLSHLTAIERHEAVAIHTRFTLAKFAVLCKSAVEWLCHFEQAATAYPLGPSPSCRWPSRAPQAWWQPLAPP